MVFFHPRTLNFSSKNSSCFFRSSDLLAPLDVRAGAHKPDYSEWYNNNPLLGSGGGMGTLCRGGFGGGLDILYGLRLPGGGWGSAPFMNLPIQTLPIPSENAGGATCRRRAASCTDISTFGAHSNLAHSNLAGVGWGGDRQSLSEG